MKVRLSRVAFLTVRADSAGLWVATLVDSASAGALPLEIPWHGRTGPGGPVLGEGTYRLTAKAWSEGDSASADPIDVDLDLTPPRHVETRIAEGDSAVRDGETLVIDTTWDDQGYLIEPDFTGLDSDTLGGLRRVPMGATTRLDYTVSFRNTRADTTVRVPITAIDGAGNAAADSSLAATLRNGPVPLGSVLEDSSRVLHNGRTVAILSRWDMDGYGLSLDVTAVDNGTGPPAAFAGLGDGLYRIVYTVSADNTVSDGDSLRLPITAVNRSGGSFTDGSLLLCLSNTPPVHAATRLLHPKEAFRNLDTLSIETIWESPAGLPIAVRGEFQGISTRFEEGDDAFAQVDDSTFVVTYRIPATNEMVDADSILIPIFASDSGCGREAFRGLWVGLDNTPPDGIPVLDPIPSSTTDAKIVVTGLGFGTPSVAVYRNDSLAVVSPLGPDGAYSAAVPLVPGPQEISARLMDAAGNPGGPSAPRRIVRVAGAGILIPKPFRAGDLMAVSHPTGWNRVEARLLNLEGTLVRSWSFPDPGRYVEIPWDGRNGAGERVLSGPFLLRWEGWFAGGGREENVWPVLYLR